MIRTTSKTPNGHHRAGAFHHPRGSDWPDSRFTTEQRDQLRADPRLVVEEIEGEPASPAPAGADALSPTGEGAALAKRAAELDEREGALNDLRDTLNAKRKELEAREATLDMLKNDEGFRAFALRRAIRGVLATPKDGDLTRDGRPTTEAVEARAGFGLTISARERDEHHQAVLAEQAGK